MEKTSPIAADITRLKTKIAERTGEGKGGGIDAGLRTLRKRLKRAQRKNRAPAMRLAHAQGKKVGASASGGSGGAGPPPA